MDEGLWRWEVVVWSASSLARVGKEAVETGLGSFAWACGGEGWRVQMVACDEDLEGAQDQMFEMKWVFGKGRGEQWKDMMDIFASVV